jgi:hypothetical protein
MKGHDRDMVEWSKRVHAELKVYEYSSCKIENRCCRAVKGGCVRITCFEDPMLMTEYTPRLNFCPECGRQLYQDDE